MDFSIDLDKLSNPKNFKILFYITDLYVNNGKMCRVVDSTNWVLVPPPDFNILMSENPVVVSPDGEKDITVTLVGDTALQTEAELYINKTDPSISLSFPITNMTSVSSLTNGSLTLHLNVSNSEFKSSKSIVFPLVANISFPPTITKGSDTFHNNKTTYLLENLDFTVNIERPLLPFERIGVFASNLKPIGDFWQLLAPIGAAVLSLIYLIRIKRKKNNDGTKKYQK